MATATNYNPAIPAFDEGTDEDRCVQILATFGLDAVASPPVDSDSASLVNRADLVRPAPPVLPHLAGVAWKVANLPFHVIAGGLGAVLGSLRLGARAFNRALAFFHFGRRAARDLPDDIDLLLDFVCPDLPQDIVLDIASRVGPPRSNLQSMRSTCKAWRAAVPSTNGPMLLLSCLDEDIAPFKILALQILSSEGGDVSMVRCPFFSRPRPPPLPTRSLLPHAASVWGAVDGFIALQKEGTFDLYLLCMHCCQNPVHLARLPFGFSTGSRLEMAAHAGDVPNGGVFFHGLPVSRLAILFSDRPTMFTDQRIDAYGYRQWAFYPGTEDEYVNSVGFLGASHFVAVSSHLRVVIGSVQVTYPSPENWWLYTPVESEPLISLDIPVEGEVPPGMLSWGSYGNHVFTCAERVYVCVMLRSVSDEDEVSSMVYSLDRLPDGDFALARTYDIGNFAIYLGANQALALPATESKNQLSNTIYIPDDDGVESTPRIWSVNIASGETDSIMFPPGVNPVHYGRATWAAPPPLNVPFWHCDTKMAR